MDVVWMDRTMEQGESDNAINQCLAEDRIQKFYLGLSQQPYGLISETWIASLKRIKEQDSLPYTLRKLQRWGEMLAVSI